MNNNNRKEKFSGYSVAVGLFLIIFVNIGSSPTISIFLPELVKWMERPFAEISPMITISTFSGFIAMALSSKIVEKLTPKWCILIGTTSTAIKYFGFGLATQPFHLYIAAIFGGIGFSMANMPTISAIASNWFYHHKKLVITIIGGGFGLGASLWTMSAGLLNNSIGYKNSYYLLATFVLVVGTLSNLLLVKNKPEDVGQKMLGYEDFIEEQERLSKQKIETSLDGPTVKEVHKSVSFWLLIVGLFCGGGVLSVSRDYCVSMWISLGIDSVTAASYLSLVVLLGGVVVMFSGGFAEKFGYRKYIFVFMGALSLNMLFGAIASLTMVVSFVYAQLVFFAASYPSGSGLPQMSCLSMFGTRSYSEIVMQAHSMNMGGQAIYAIVIGYLYDKTGSFATSYGMLTTLTLISAICLLLAYRLSPMYKIEQITKEQE